MIELPEAETISVQMADTLAGKRVSRVMAGASPHKYAWLYGEPDAYEALARGRTVTGGAAVGGFAVAEVGDAAIVFSEGMNVRFHEPGHARPEKHQLLVELDDGSALTASAQMYGGAGIVKLAAFDNPFYRRATEVPSPLTAAFTREYFATLAGSTPDKLSAKAFLATEQRVPGLGNGVLQDILFRARINPRRKLRDLDRAQLAALYESVRGTLTAMTERGGRDTELDLFGRAGGYATLMSRRTVGTPCPQCGEIVEKASYLGGSVYYCPGCQPV